MDNLELLLKLIIPGSCFIINIFCIGYSLGLNTWSERNKAYIIYLIAVNLWIITDPLIFNLELAPYQIHWITQLRPIAWLSIGILFINLVYKLTFKEYDIYIKIYFIFYVLFSVITLFSNLLISNYVFVGWYVESLPGPLFSPAILITIILPAVHSFNILYKNLKTAQSKVHKIQLTLLLSGSLIMFLLGVFSDILMPFVFELKYPIRLGSSIMAFQVLFAMPAILKYDLLTMALDKFIMDMFRESGDGILIVDVSGNILNSNQMANYILNKSEFPLNGDNKLIGSNINDYFEQLENNHNYNDFVTNLKGFEQKFYSISSSKLSNTGYQLGRMYLIRDISDKIQSEKELYISQQILEKAQQTSKTGNWEENHVSGEISWSKNCKRLLGFNENEILNHEIFWSCVHPEDRKWMQPLWNELEGSGRDHKGVFRVILKDGTIRYIEEQAEFIFENDKVIKTTGSIQDVTEAYLAQKELEISETRLKEAQEVAHIGSFDYSLIKESVVWSDELFKIYGLEKDKYNPSSEGFFNLVHQDDRQRIRDIIELAIEDHVLLEYDHRLIRSDNFDIRIMHCRAKISYDKNNNPVRIAGTSQDVTKIRKAEAEVKNSREQLRKLASHLQRAQEEERARISREIHDELGQELTGIKMDISWLSNSLEKPSEKVKDRIDSLNNLIDMTINSVRRISSELRPGVLDDLGLQSAIEWYVDEFQIRTNIKCDIKLDEIDRKIGGDTSTAVYRIVQESLTNVARHSKATKVTLSLKAETNYLFLKILDNGIGFDNDIINYEKSLGILGMEERVNILGGTFSIVGTKTNGTKINVEIPYSI